MNRRELVVFSAALLAGAVASPSVHAASGGHVTYSPAAFAKMKASGRPLLLDFYASW
ncbi:MAG: hypothetical protein ACI8W7_003147 [Gammaproteobacteria bacterium]|jgi:hypothetical protein